MPDHTQDFSNLSGDFGNLGRQIQLHPEILEQGGKRKKGHEN
jgi:hypothetical protein